MAKHSGTIQKGFDRQAAYFRTRIGMRNSDTDQFRHINNAAIASFFEEARMSVFAQDDLAVSMQGKNVVVAHLAIDFLKEIFYPGELEIWTTPERAGTTSFTLIQGLYAGDTLCARAKAVCVLLDSQSRQPVALPDALRGQLAPGRAGGPRRLPFNDQH